MGGPSYIVLDVDPLKVNKGLMYRSALEALLSICGQELCLKSDRPVKGAGVLSIKDMMKTWKEEGNNSRNGEANVDLRKMSGADGQDLKKGQGRTKTSKT